MPMPWPPARGERRWVALAIPERLTAPTRYGLGGPGRRWASLWYDHRQPTNDRKLAVIAEVCTPTASSTGSPWLWSTGHPRLPAVARTRRTVTTSSPTEIGLTESPRDRASRRSFAFLQAGTTGWTLGAHISEPLQPPRRVRERGAAVRTKALPRRNGRVDSMAGLYALVGGVGQALPEEGFGWTLDVVATPVGWLGSTRRLPRTGLWYAAATRITLPGSRPPLVGARPRPVCVTPESASLALPPPSTDLASEAHMP